MCSNDACEAVAIRNGHGAVTQCRSPLHQFIGVRSPAEEAEIRRYLQFHVCHTFPFLSKKPVQKPLPWVIITIMPCAEKPVPPSLIIFHAVIVPVFTGVQPPFALDTLRPVGPPDGMYLAPISEQHRRIIGYGC